jgi:prepilin-type N-terminal cleavage/methylation domain-containing protein
MQRMSHSAGFTLVELVIVLVLLGILAIAIIPRDPGRTLDVRAQADELASDIRYAQSLSMTRGQRFCVSLITGGYSLTTAASNCVTTVEHPAGMTQPVLIQNATLGWTNLPNNYVVFDGKGIPYTNTTTALLTSNAVITFSGASNTVTISPTTGRVAVGP